MTLTDLMPEQFSTNYEGQLRYPRVYATIITKVRNISIEYLLRKITYYGRINICIKSQCELV